MVATKSFILWIISILATPPPGRYTDLIKVTHGFWNTESTAFITKKWWIAVYLEMTLMKAQLFISESHFLLFSLPAKDIIKQAVKFRRAKDFFVPRLHYPGPRYYNETKLPACMEPCGSRAAGWGRHPSYVPGATDMISVHRRGQPLSTTSPLVQSPVKIDV